MKRFEEVEFKRTIEKSTAEHEIFMSFTDDIGAEMFVDWWDIEGSKTFNKYYEENE